MVTCKTRSDEQIINEITELNLTISESEDESANEAEGPEGEERTMLSKNDIQKASQIVLQYSRDINIRFSFYTEVRHVFLEMRLLLKVYVDRK